MSMETKLVQKAISTITVTYSDGTTKEVNKGLLITEVENVDVLEPINMAPTEVVGTVMAFAGSFVDQIDEDVLEAIMGADDDDEPILN